MKKYFLVIGLLLFIFINFVSAVTITDDLHVNIQVLDSGGDVATGTYDFVFNISTNSNCGSVIYSNSTTLTTDSRGIISYYLTNVSLDYDNQYWLCYYRDGVLINISQIARVPYAFRARNVTLSGVEVDQNLNMGSYNITAPYFFGNGSSLTGISGTQIFNNLNWINASTANGSYYSITNPYEFWNNTWAGFNKTYADSLYKALGVETWNSTYSGFNKTYADTLYAGIAWNYNQTTAAVNQILNFNYYNATTIGGVINTSYYVPYTGASSNVALGVYNLTTMGKLGIGTTFPNAKLDVQTGVNDSLVASFGVDANNRISIYDYETGGFRSIYAVDDGDYGSLNLGHATSPYLFIKTGGNVGVGTVNPQEKLEVSGRINATTDVCITGGICLSNSIVSGSETDPLWTANFTAYNASWSTTYNLTYANWNKTYADTLYYDIDNNILGYWNNTFATFNKTYADSLYYALNNPYGYLNETTLSASETDPLWTANQSSYYNKTQIETNFTNYYNSTQTDSQIGLANTSMKNYADNTFITLANEGDLNVNRSNYWDGLDSPLDILGSQINNNLNWINATTLSAAETDPLWTGNFSTYLTLFNWNKTYADSLYKALGVETWNSTYSGFNKTYADILYSTKAEPLWTANSTVYAKNTSFNSSIFTTTTNITIIDKTYYPYSTNPLAFYNSTTLGGVVNSSFYIPYIGSSANVFLGDYNFSIGTNDFFVDASAGRVGIGTATPQNTLDVKGNANVTGNLTISSSKIYVNGNGDMVFRV